MRGAGSSERLGPLEEDYISLAEGKSWKTRFYEKNTLQTFTSTILTKASFPNHAAPQHEKTILYQCVTPCWKNRLTLKLWRDFAGSEKKRRNVAPMHHQSVPEKALFSTAISGWFGKGRRFGQVVTGAAVATKKAKLSRHFFA
jgi:hypothetical protein